MTTIAIPAELRRPHPLVTTTQKAATGLKPREDGRLAVGSEKGIAHLVVSREQLRRALLVLQAIAAEAERRGHELRAVDKSGYGDRCGLRRVAEAVTGVVKLRGLVPSRLAKASANCAVS